MIRLEKLSKRFPNASRAAVDGIDLDVSKGEICVLLGPSGCGKTTTLKMINRLIAPTSGRINIDGKDTSDIDPIQLRRQIGYVIQQVGLFPNMTVEENIGVVPQLLGWSRSTIQKRASELLELMALDPSTFAKRYPNELSGGQAQRVGVARALAVDPPVMLMDEPFGAIDPIARGALQNQFLKLQENIRKTVIIVSHDIDEAIRMADKIAIFRDGRVEQFDTPDQILAHPANEFVADFFGNDRTLRRLRLINILEALERPPIFIKTKESVSSALKLMEAAGETNIVTISADGRACGFLRIDDVRNEHGSCEQFHLPLPASVDVRKDVLAAVSIMLAHDVSWLACVDDQGTYRGSINRRDITQLLSKQSIKDVIDRV